MSRFFDNEYNDKIANLHLPRFGEFPNIELYIDQLLTYIEEQLDFLPLGENEKLLTPSMVNNYVKQGIVAPTVKKRYARYHIAYLIVVCILKQTYSINEISELIKIQISAYPIETAYDYFCTEIENAAKSVFLGDCIPTPDSAKTTTPVTDLIRSVVYSFANKLYAQKCLQTTGGDYSDVKYR